MKFTIVCCLLVIMTFDLSKGESKVGCVKNDGTLVEDGESYKENDCVQCSCWYGTIRCTRIRCRIPKCSDGSKPVALEGNCCPSCPKRRQRIL